jgi:hypothetical protein
MKMAVIILITIIGSLVAIVVIANGEMEREEEENKLFRDSLTEYNHCDDECYSCKNKCWCKFSTWKNK